MNQDNASVKNNKNPKIQIIRALAIIAVVMIHTCPNGYTQVFARPFINFCVATFLFLSGYLTDVSKIKLKDFYLKRILRVIIPYTIWSILYTSAGFVSSGSFDFKQYFINYITAGGAPVMYYIFVYIQFVLLTPLLGKLLKKKYWWIGYIIAPISLIYVYYFLFSGTTSNVYISTIWKVCCLGWFSFYYLGLYLKNTPEPKKFNKKFIIPFYFIAIILQMAEGYMFYKFGEVNCGTQLKLSSLLTSSLFILIAYSYINSEKYTGNCKPLVFIGNYSFGIYISHCIIIYILSYFLPFWDSIPFGANSLIVFAITLLCVVVGKLICRERISKYLGLY